MATLVATPTLWLALAALCVLHPDHPDQLTSHAAHLLRGGNAAAQPAQPRSSAMQQQQQQQDADAAAAPPEPRPTCENHDDGVTAALVLCEECGGLCAECDRVLHLSKRTRLHRRAVFRHHHQDIRVDLHEGCGRVKLWWLLALADANTLKAMLELRGPSEAGLAPSATGGGGIGSNGGPSSSGSSHSCCRFCGSPAQSQSLLSPSSVPVCGDPECQSFGREACLRVHPCGHPCGGLRDEAPCLPCLHGCDPTAPLAAKLKQDADDMCMICFSEALSAAPALQLGCGHVFHAHCCRAVLRRRWPGPRITFGFSLCPICKVPMQHPRLEELLAPVHGLYEDVRRKALMRLEYEGLNHADAITARYQNDPAAFALDRYAYYVCFKCGKAYYGGEARCGDQAVRFVAGQPDPDEYDPQELVCGGCSDVARAQMCPKHGTDFLEYKCRYCCSVAVFFCFGTTHFCNACHDDFQRVTNLSRAELPACPAGPRAQPLEGNAECPLHVQHPPTGEEFALGCGVCRNAHTF